MLLVALLRRHRLATRDGVEMRDGLVRPFAAFCGWPWPRGAARSFDDCAYTRRLPRRCRTGPSLRGCNNDSSRPIRLKGT